MPIIIPSTEPALLEWQLFLYLLRDLQEHERRDTVDPALRVWNFLLEKFRSIEQVTLIMQEPSRETLLYHSICLHRLISLGQFKQLNIENVEADMREALNASVAELEHVLNQWHGKVPPQIELSLKESIFGG